MTKLALCVGINAYPGDSALRGCVNDANDWASALGARGYGVTTLLDRAATGDLIIEELHALVADARFGDRIVFTYSGHGTHYKDTSGDEPDRWDEAICPVDVFTQGAILDDAIAGLLASRRVGVRATMVADSCNSGTVARLLAPAGKAKYIPAFGIPPAPRNPQPQRVRRAPAQPVLLLAGCRDDQYSYDGEDRGRPCGAFTNAAMRALAANPDPNAAAWWQVHRTIRNYLPSERYPQTPQCQASAWQKRWHIA